MGPVMSEDELLTGLTDALTLAGWRWFHMRRSDAAIVQGSQGWPDLFAVHPTRRLALAMETKSDSGRLTPDQAAWLAMLDLVGIPAVMVRPDDYDRMLNVILGRTALVPPL